MIKFEPNDQERSTIENRDNDIHALMEDIAHDYGEDEIHLIYDVETAEQGMEIRDLDNDSLGWVYWDE